MDGNLSHKDESISSSFMELLKKYTIRVDEPETLVKESTHTKQQKTQNDEIEKLKDPRNKSQLKSNSISDSNQQIDSEKMNINYKIKWEESEAKYRQLEIKYHQLETGTIKQLQNKIDQLQRDYNQIKLIKDRINEICSCRQLTNNQFEQLKYLINNNNNNLSNETIANKNDFHQQTIKLRSILVKHNDEFLNKIEELIKKKRKRNQYEDDYDDDQED